LDVFWRGKKSVEQVKLFAWFEAYCLAGCDAHLGTSPWISTDAGLSRLYREDAEAAKFDPFAGDQRLLHALKDGVDGRLRLGPRKPCALDNPLDKVLLDHEWSPFLLTPGTKFTDGLSQ
jgi:hypothetical protein